MQNLNDMWLRGQAAQHSFMQLAAYNAAFVGTAGLQAWRAGVTAPQAFWGAMARAAATPPQGIPAARKAAPKAVAVKEAPKVVAPKVAPKVVAPKEAPKAVAPKAVAESATPAVAPKSAKPKAAPKPTSAAPKPAKPKAAPASVKPDDLTQLKGVGATLAKSLNAQGIETFAQLAALTPKRIEKIDVAQKGFKMIAARYKLVDQAKARLA